MEPTYFNPHLSLIHIFIMYQPTLPVRGVTFEEIDRHGFVEFQPTLPVRGATARSWPGLRRRSYFNPHSPCGE